MRVWTSLYTLESDSHVAALTVVVLGPGTLCRLALIGLPRELLGLIPEVVDAYKCNHYGQNNDLSGACIVRSK